MPVSADTLLVVERVAPERRREDAAAAENSPTQTLPQTLVDDDAPVTPPRLDEATMLARHRERAFADLNDAYALLFEHMSLPQPDRENLLAELVEMQMEGTYTATKRGRTVGQQERYERIAAVIGDRNLVRFLELEQNRAAYWETAQIVSLLRRHELPLSAAQRDALFELVVDVHTRYDTTPPAELDNQSLERFEYELRQLDETDRHVIELATSVLSPTQVARLFEAYQRMSYQRGMALERQKRAPLMDQNGRPLWSYPGRWQ